MDKLGTPSLKIVAVTVRCLRKGAEDKIWAGEQRVCAFGFRVEAPKPGYCVTVCDGL